MNSLSAQLDQLRSTFKGLDKNIQRVLILGAIFLVYFVIDTYAVQPLVTEYDKITKEITKTITTRKTFEKQVQLVTKELGLDPSLPESDQLDALKQQITQLDETFKTASAQFVSADEMIKFLNDLLVNGKNLELLSIEKMPIEHTMLKTITNKKVLNSGANTEEQQSISESRVFRHGVKFQLNGRYVEIVKYMRAVESLPWRIFWEASDLNTEKYPNSTVSFEIYTLSLDENWLTL